MNNRSGDVREKTLIIELGDKSYDFTKAMKRMNELGRPITSEEAEEFAIEKEVKSER